MKNYTKAEIESLITRFEARVLPKAEWTHQAHLAVAIWYVSKYSFAEALSLIRNNITAHNTSVGTPNTDTEGYHETITRFWTVAAANYLSGQNIDDITRLCNNFINSDFASSSYPLQFYSDKRLFSVEARRKWLEPDLKNLE